VVRVVRVCLQAYARLVMYIAGFGLFFTLPLFFAFYLNYRSVAPDRIMIVQLASVGSEIFSR
jgi:hypothetical protein